MRPFLGLDEPAPDTAPAFAILPVPFDGGASWKRGAAAAPAAILMASEHVELYDLVTGLEPHEAGIETLAPIHHDGPPETLAGVVDDRVRSILDAQRLPVVLGGDHSVSIGAIRALAGRTSELGVLQLDAHADRRDTYEGSTHSHACVMARARELCPVTQVGLRSLSALEARRLEGEPVVWAHEIHEGGADWQERAIAGLPPDVYLTIDLDVLDPSVLPATGTPEPGGLDWRQLIGFLAAVIARRRVVGFDVVELLPTAGRHHCDFLAARLVHHLLALILRARA